MIMYTGGIWIEFLNAVQNVTFFFLHFNHTLSWYFLVRKKKKQQQLRDCGVSAQ